MFVVSKGHCFICYN